MNHPHDPQDLASRLLGLPYRSLDARNQKITRHVVTRSPITRSHALEDPPQPTFGQRAADLVASFGGSWIFVGLFGAAMALWVGLNAYLLTLHGKTFDPYPYILLNLFLSMLAAIQAPIILMSQNRHSERDRDQAEHDYEVNLKAEMEILLLHDKIDALREKQWEELLVIQNEQLKLLSGLISKPIEAHVNARPQ